MSKRRVAVTGVGCVSPVGLNAPQTWEALVNGKSGISSVTRFDASQLPSSIAGEASGFDPLVYLSSKDLRKMDRFVQMGVVAGLES
ncbi:MAG: beta-ketoacyl synthase N-terminal-like domain-containing protein, partial [Pseudomonadota bacterium]|nr:beta-ketoacyl synthase N-terminal-like domain-containing protein [Pseudomonadota bacterium]